MSFEMTSNPEYSTFIALSRYAKWLPEKQRRETWEETVDRYIDFWVSRNAITEEEAQELFDAILNLDIVPSMRALMTAGEALDRDNVAGFNCSYRELSGKQDVIKVHTTEMQEAGIIDPIPIYISKPIAFDEIMYILLVGTGVGFSCERQFVAELPIIGHSLPRSTYYREEKNYPGVPKDELSTISNNIISVADSKYGWASALRILILEVYNGNFEVTWDLSMVRPAGTPLKTFGGRASGPEPLDDLFNYILVLFRKANERKLTSIEAHGLVCKIAEVVVCGGVRRSALISLSNLSDDRMRHAKSGQWWDEHPEFALANNSICYTEKPDSEIFLKEALALIQSKSGERGIFNRQASDNQASKNNRREVGYNWGTNPCSEIILRNQQFCNLSEVIVRDTDTYQDLERKIRLATRLGTLQATLTDFRYLNPEWAKNTKEEALLGVSLTGIMDNAKLSGEWETKAEIVSTPFHKKFGHFGDLGEVLTDLKLAAIEENKVWAKKLGINQAAAITAVKPSGTVSQLVDSASGIHPRYSEYYIRTVRADIKDPLAKMMVDAGFPVAPDVMNPTSTLVFSFPMKAPRNAVFRNDRTAIQQLEHWLLYQRAYCEHKPSVTVYVKDEEWPEVIGWTWEYFDEISGISFLPHSDHSYRQAPYQEISEAEYNDWVEIMPESVDWADVGLYEKEDNTTSSQTMACSGSSCEVVDLT